MPLFRRRHPPPLDDEAVGEIIARGVALARPMGRERTERLRELTVELYASRRWEAVAGFDLDAEKIVTIAANAAIPILELDASLYRNVHAVLVRAGRSTLTGQRTGPVDGVVSDEPLVISGQASPHGGPVSLAWDAVLRDSRNPGLGRNVVIHEFAHKIDMLDGYTDGLPPVRAADVSEWAELIEARFVDPDGTGAGSVLRPYAWASRPEFFAVASEAFFCTPGELQDADPELYDALSGFYRQDPAGSDDT